MHLIIKINHQQPLFSSIPKEHQLAFYCAANKLEGSKNVFEYLIRELTNPKSFFGRKQRLLRAIACTKDLNELKW